MVHVSPLACTKMEHHLNGVPLGYKHQAPTYLASKMVELAAPLTVFYRALCALLYIENDAEIFPAYYTWKVAEKWFNMAFMMNKLAMINSCEIILGK